MFKEPLEEMSDEDNGTTNPLLNNTELKIIFGFLPPIYEVHRFVDLFVTKIFIDRFSLLLLYKAAYFSIQIFFHNSTLIQLNYYIYIGETWKNINIIFF